VLKQFLLDAFRPYGPTIVITRTNLHNALIKSIGEKVKINLGVTVSEIIQENSKACVTFSTGEKEVFDLVVGADGIHSQIRDMVFGRDYLKYYGYNIWAFWTPHGLGSPRGAVSVVSGGKMYFVYPMEDKAIIMLASTSDIDMKDTGKIKEKLHALFSDFKSSVGDMINAIEDPAHLFHDKLAYIDMPVWYKDRVVLLGDAQHATSPITGMGASMALEDAYVLAEELKKISSTQDIPSALENYVKRRDRRIKKFRKISHVIEKWIMVKSPIVEKIRNIVLYVVPVGYFTYELKKLLKEEI
jgi:2-polyprenyl-6-methoxyphenol hydroxylase-like FAD-dependent oxidoreductase